MTLGPDAAKAFGTARGAPTAAFETAMPLQQSTLEEIVESE